LSNTNLPRRALRRMHAATHGSQSAVARGIEAREAREIEREDARIARRRKREDRRAARRQGATALTAHGADMAPTTYDRIRGGVAHV
jgi:hypothetical protein